MIDQNHRVFRFKVDFSLPQDELPAPVQDRLSNLINQRLTQLMDKLFSEFSESNQIIKLDLLNLDLGKIVIDDLERELPLRFEEVLRKNLNNLKQNPELKKEVLNHGNTQNNELELLNFYLRKGGFPWWKPKHINNDYKVLFHKLVDSSNHGLKEMFESLIGVEWPRKRIILSFEDVELKQIIQILRPLNSKTIIAYSDQLQAQHKKEPILKTDQENFRNIHWKMILKYLYEKRGSEFNQKSFLKQILLDLSTALGMEYAALVFKMEDYVVRFGDVGNKDNSFFRSIIVLAKEIRTLDQKEITQPQASWIEGLLSSVPKDQLKEASAWIPLLSGQQLQLPQFGQDTEVWLKLFKRLWVYDQKKAIQFIRQIAILGGKGNDLLIRLSPEIMQKAFYSFCPEQADELLLLRSDLLKLAKIKGIPGWTFLEFKQLINLHFLRYYGMTSYNQLELSVALKSLLKKIADSSGTSYTEFITTVYKRASESSSGIFYQSKIMTYLQSFLWEGGINHETINSFLKKPGTNSDKDKNIEGSWVYTPGKESVSEYINRLEKQFEKSNFFDLSYHFWQKPEQIKLWMPAMLRKWSENKSNTLLNILWPSLSPFALLWLKDLSFLLSRMSKTLKFSNLSNSALKEVIWITLLELGFQTSSQVALVRESLKLIANKVKVNQEEFLTIIYGQIIKNKADLKLGKLLPKLLEKAIQSSLFFKLKKPVSNPEKIVIGIAPELRLLSLFFEKGELPPGLNTNDLRKTVADLLARSPEALQTWLKTLIRNETWRGRLVHFFSSPVLAQLMNLIESQAGNYAYRLIDFLKPLEDTAGLKQTTEKTYWEQVWEVLNELAWKGFRPRSFIVDILRKLARQKGISLTTLLEHMEEISLNNEEFPVRTLKAIISYEKLRRSDEITAEQEAQKKGIVDLSVDFSKMNPEQLGSWLRQWSSAAFQLQHVKGSTNKQLENFATRFLNLSQTSKVNLWNLIDDRNVIVIFNALLDPDQMLRVMDVSELIVTTRQKKENSKHTFFPLELSTILLQAILIDRGSLSNQKSFIGKLLRDWARAHSISYPELVKQLWPVAWELAPIFRHSGSLEIFTQVLKEQLIEDGAFPVSSPFQESRTLASKEPDKKEKPYKKLWDKAEKPLNFDDIWIVQNVGLVILWPYFNVLFERAGFMEDSTFINEKAQQKAIYLLEYLVSGNATPTEDMLVLNKVLCAYPIAAPLDIKFKVNKKLRKLCEGLLETAIGYWEILGDTSVDAFRETFLMREGRLGLTEENWHIQVVPKAYDVLLKQLPWGISPVNLSWMDMMIKVEWE